MVRSTGTTIGEIAVTYVQRQLVMRLYYTFRECFVKKLEDFRTTDLLHHQVRWYLMRLPQDKVAPRTDEAAAVAAAAMAAL